MKIGLIMENLKNQSNKKMICKRQEELKQMKCLSMEEVVKSFGVEVVKSGSNVMFKALWRNEKVASVSIRQAADDVWVFKDHGTGGKGTNIDLVMKITNWSYIETVQWLRKQLSFFSFPKPKKVNQNKETDHKVVLSNKWQIISNQDPKYLLGIFDNERHLSEKNLKELNIRELNIKHIKSQKNYLLAGHQNIKGGWELFSPKEKGFKSCIYPKGISLITKESKVLIVAESLIDVISAQNILKIEGDLLSLNSTNLSKNAGIILSERKKKYDRILLCLDNDEAGEKGSQVLKEELSGLGKIERYDYQDGDDPSEEWIMMNRKIRHDK
jgi:hypothetical protein